MLLDIKLISMRQSPASAAANPTHRVSGVATGKTVGANGCLIFKMDMKKRITLGLVLGGHDASACVFDGYKVLAAVQLERLTRIKTDGGRVPTEAIDEVLRITGLSKADVTHVSMSRDCFPYRWFDFSGRPMLYRLKRKLEYGVRKIMGKDYRLTITKESSRASTTDVIRLFDTRRFLQDSGFRPETVVSFYDHHYAHVLPCLFHNPDWENALLYSADGGGDTGYYSFRFFDGKSIECMFGGEEWVLKVPPPSSLALAYGWATVALGFRMLRHEGKLTGLAAYGKPTLLDKLLAKFRVEDDGEITSDFSTRRELRDWVLALCKGVCREDVASSFQELLHVRVPESIQKLLSRHPTKNLGLSGGLFANVRLNQVIAEKCDIDRLFIYPAMSDAGLCTGGVLQNLLEADGMETWLSHRHRCENLYLGGNYDDSVDAYFESVEDMERIDGDPIAQTVAAMVAGDAVAIYRHGMEFGPRALGARSVMASPHDNDINRSLNERMERSEFMPFAPFVRDVDADEVFHLPESFHYAARFMTITCQVKDEWRDRIPAVIHVDGTARPQVIFREDNELYYDILSAFKAATGLPVLINTSFNVHEEPIINSPAECAKALLDNRVDGVVTAKALYRRKSDRRK